MRTSASLLTSIAATACSRPSAHADAAVPRTVLATYAVSYRGIGAGTLTFKLRARRRDRPLHLRDPRRPERARAAVRQRRRDRTQRDGDRRRRRRPIEWQLDDGKSGNADDGELHFDWSRKRVTGAIEGKTIELPPSPALQDRSSIQIAVVDVAVARRRARHHAAHRRQSHQALHLHEEGDRDGRHRARQARHRRSTRARAKARTACRASGWRRAWNSCRCAPSRSARARSRP